MLAQSPKSERSDIRFEAWKPVFVERDMAAYMADLYSEICKLLWKLDFTAHGIIESSEFGPSYIGLVWALLN
jgi:hypothetical protein